jgi:hypothetical protein
MSLSDLASLGSFISGFAVLISLIFLYFQLRQVNAQVLQTEKNQRALMNQGVISRGINISMFVAQPQINDLMTRMQAGETEFSGPEISVLRLVLRVYLLHLQDHYVQHAAGLIDQISYDNVLSGFRYGVLTQPVMRAIWQRARRGFAPELVTLLDGLIKDMQLAEPVNFVAQLKADLAEVMH